MKQYEMKEVTREQKELVNVTCDWCGIVSDEPFLGDSLLSSEWFCLSYEESSGEGNDYSNSGWDVEDLCHDCIDKLKVLLEENGVTVAEIDR